MSDLSVFGNSAHQQPLAAIDIQGTVSQLDAIFLDCDGTLIMNAEQIHEQCVAKTLHHFYNSAGLDYNEEAHIRFKKVWIEGLGKGIANCYKAFVQTMPLPDAFALSQKVADSNVFEAAYEHDYINKDLRSEIVVREGMKQLIQAANDAGVPVAIVSNAKQSILEASVKAAGVADKVQLIIGKDTVEGKGFKAKPDGGSYECARIELEKITGKKIDMAKSAGAEDTNAGLQSLEDAGVRTRIYCDNGTEIHSALEEPDVPVTVVTKVGSNILTDLVNSFQPPSSHLAGNDNSVDPPISSDNNPSPKNT